MRSVLPAFVMLCLTAAPAFADGDKPEHKITQADSFIMIEPMYLTVVDSGHPQGMLMVAIGLDIPDAALRAQANLGMPVLRDAYLRNMMSYAATVVEPDRQPDVVMIADRLQRVTDRELRRKGARVLLAQVALQPKQN
jgi:hypothetical protein